MRDLGRSSACCRLRQPCRTEDIDDIADRSGRRPVSPPCARRMMVSSAVEEDVMAGRLVDVGFLLFTGEGLRPNQVEPESSVVDLGMLGEETGLDSMGVIDQEDGWPALVREGCIGGFEDL